MKHKKAVQVFLRSGSMVFAWLVFASNMIFVKGVGQNLILNNDILIKRSESKMENKEKTTVKELKDKLFLKKENGGNLLSKEEFEQSEMFSEGYKKFLNTAKTEREIVKYVVREAQKLGFVEFDKDVKYEAGDKVYSINRARELVLAVIGKNGVKNGTKLAVAHIDSPRLDLKPNPLIEQNDFAMFKTHYYGGIKRYQWTALPLALHGRIVKKDGSFVDVSIGENENEPCFYISDLPPHLSREQVNKKMSEAITGEDLNVLVGGIPFKSDEGSELVKLNIINLLNEKYGIVESDFISADLQLVPNIKVQDVGFDRSMIGGYGHDDRAGSYACMEAIFKCEVPEETAIVVLTDKEEVGSDGNTGMQGKFLKYFISDLAAQESVKGRHVLSKSKCLSVDTSGAFDPVYSSLFELANSNFINRGVILEKCTGNAGKGGASDASAEFTGEVRKILEDNNILWQSGQMGKLGAGGGGTVAKYLANMNIDVIDLAIPALSLHAPFEVISKIDLYMAHRAVVSFFKN